MLSQYFVRALAEFLTSEICFWVWSSLIIAYSFKWIVSLKWESLQLKSQLKETLLILSNSKNRYVFCENFLDTDSKISILEKVRRPWKDFTRSFIKAVDETQTQEIFYASKEVGEIFDEAVVIRENIDRPFYQSIARHIMGLGFFGTFCGLSAGVFLGKAVILEKLSLEEFQSSLTQLLGGASLAFFSAMVGTICSLVYNRMERSSQKENERLIREIKNQLRQKVETLSQEKMVRSQLIETSKQTENIQKIVEGFLKLSEAQIKLGEKTFGEDMGKSFQLVVDGLTVNLSECLKKITGKFQSEMMEHAHVMTSTMKETTEAMVRGIKESLRFSSQSLEHPMNTLYEGIQTLTEKTTGTARDWSAVIGQQNEQIQRFTKLHQHLAYLMEPLIKSNNSLSQVYRSSEIILSKSILAAEKITDAVNKMEAINTQVKHHWDAYCERFEGVDESLKVIFQETNHSLVSYSERFKGYTHDLDKHMSQGILSLAGAVSDLNQVVGNIPEAIKNVRP